MSAAAPHAGQPVRHAGAPLGSAARAVVLLHGRGDSAAGILSLADALGRPGVAFLAPEAAGGTWYPHSFLAPLGANEPWLSGALGAVARAVAQAEAAGIGREKIVLAGFSQGACLAAEFVARNAGRWGGLAVLSGGLIGSAEGAGDPPEDKRFDYPGRLEGTPVFLGCSDRDPHIPRARVERSAAVLEAMGAAVDLHLYPTLGHAINADELAAFRVLLNAL